MFFETVLYTAMPASYTALARPACARGSASAGDPRFTVTALPFVGEARKLSIHEPLRFLYRVERAIPAGIAGAVLSLAGLALPVVTVRAGASMNARAFDRGHMRDIVLHAAKDIGFMVLTRQTSRQILNCGTTRRPLL